MGSADDHGIEVLKKSGEEVIPGSKADYYIKVGPTPGHNFVVEIDPNTSAKSSVHLVTHDHSTPVTTLAYTELISSTSDIINHLQIFDSSGQMLVLAVGAAASEVDKLYIFPGGNGGVDLTIPAASRVSVKAVSADTTGGYLAITGIK